MPMYSYQCQECKIEIERFQHNSKMPDLECENCKCCNFIRLFNKTHNRTWLNAKDNLSQKILPDAKRIMTNISKGKDKDFHDITGD